MGKGRAQRRRNWPNDTAMRGNGGKRIRDTLGAREGDECSFVKRRRVETKRGNSGERLTSSHRAKLEIRRNLSLYWSVTLHPSPRLGREEETSLTMNLAREYFALLRSSDSLHPTNRDLSLADSFKSSGLRFLREFFCR